MAPVKEQTLRRNATLELDLDEDIANLKFDGLKARDKNEVYRFCDIEKFEDELEEVIFEFNAHAPIELSSSFCLNYQNLRPEISEFDSMNFFYIRSNLTEKMEGLIIYTVSKMLTITVFYLACTNMANYEAIVKFAIRKIINVLYPKQIMIRVLHTEETTHSIISSAKFGKKTGKRTKKKPNIKIKQIYEKLGFKI
jgi:hypothetical protein